MLIYRIKSDINTTVVRFKCLIHKWYCDIFGYKSSEVLIKGYVKRFILPYAGDDSEEYW
jgi:hypothetical protein